QATAFWSATIYNTEGALVETPNSSNNAIGVGPTSWGPTIQAHTACFNADGSMDITLQANPPTDSAQLCNWIPIPTTAADPTIPGGDFIVFLRMYWPNASVLQGQWRPPGVP